MILALMMQKKVVTYMRKNMGNKMTMMLTTMLQTRVLKNMIKMITIKTKLL